jgi:hypothetical protein
MAQKQAKRALEDKDTDFRVRGRDVAPEKIARAEKRLKLSDEELLAMPSVRKYLYLLWIYLQVWGLIFWVSHTIRYKL